MATAPRAGAGRPRDLVPSIPGRPAPGIAYPGGFPPVVRRRYTLLAVALGTVAAAIVAIDVALSPGHAANVYRSSVPLWLLAAMSAAIAGGCAWAAARAYSPGARVWSLVEFAIDGDSLKIVEEWAYLALRREGVPAALTVRPGESLTVDAVLTHVAGARRPIYRVALTAPGGQLVVERPFAIETFSVERLEAAAASLRIRLDLTGEATRFARTDAAVLPWWFRA